jgi:hypothetical protein
MEVVPAIFAGLGVYVLVYGTLGALVILLLVRLLRIATPSLPLVPPSSQEAACAQDAGALRAFHFPAEEPYVHAYADGTGVRVEPGAVALPADCHWSAPTPRTIGCSELRDDCSVHLVESRASPWYADAVVQCDGAETCTVEKQDCPNGLRCVGHSAQGRCAGIRLKPGCTVND